MRKSTENLSKSILAVATVTAAIAWPMSVTADDYVLHSFTRQVLTDVYYSEGAAAGDLNGDGAVDVVYGPYWYEGPKFQAKHEIYPARAQPRERYADHFFAWIYDFDGDGWNDVFVAGFPGTPAYVYENPTAGKFDQPWKKHEVFDWVSNESPQFTSIVGDERPELVCTRDGYFGYATIDWNEPFKTWTFHPISEQVAPTRFGHGLGIGDVDGDGRADLLTRVGWFAQPDSPAGSQRWAFHPVEFAVPGGADMYAYDVDGDGDNDVITCLGAHDFGLAWYEQVQKGDQLVFRRHIIMNDRPGDNRYGVVFSEPHSVVLADMDGDGLKDIVTGKTFWSHHTKSPMWDAGAVVYWFRLVRTEQGVDWVPYQADGKSGIGRQVVVHDVNGDQCPDIVVGGMVGCSVLIHHREPTDKQSWLLAQPKPYVSTKKRFERGKPSPIDANTGRVKGALECEDLKVLRATAGRTSNQEMAGFTKDKWSGEKQLFWSGANPGDRLDLELPVASEGSFELSIAMTMARDYATVQLLLDDQPLGDPIDLYNYPDVITTGVLSPGVHKLTAGNHRLTLEITGANRAAMKGYRVGMDYVRLVPQ
ncbi:MAG: VCBS repeat-containing protein [Planctomycetes bacterium]|nr:VCBS repeat-containing protein [Planctomycetota bacterium]MBL7038780.1 VCBS repeat-containing protein [Pirellulaceae bacterium]